MTKTLYDAALFVCSGSAILFVCAFLVLYTLIVTLCLAGAGWALASYLGVVTNPPTPL